MVYISFLILRWFVNCHFILCIRSSWFIRSSIYPSPALLVASFPVCVHLFLCRCMCTCMLKSEVSAGCLHLSSPKIFLGECVFVYPNPRLGWLVSEFQGSSISAVYFSLPLPQHYITDTWHHTRSHTCLARTLLAELSS